MDFVKKILLTIFTFLLGAILSLILKPYVDQKIQEKMIPVLVKEIDAPNISQYPDDIKKQVAFYLIKYKLTHHHGGVAQNISIWIYSDNPINKSQLCINPGSEKYKTSFDNSSTLRIDVTEMRPSGYFSFDVINQSTNKIVFKEISANGKILIPSDLSKKETVGDNYIVILVLVIILLFWFSILSTFIYILWRIKKSWILLDNENKLLISLIIGLIVYQIIISSFSVWGGFLPIPRFDFKELFFAFALFLLVTRYQLIEEFLKTKTKQAKEKDSNSE